MPSRSIFERNPKTLRVLLGFTGIDGVSLKNAHPLDRINKISGQEIHKK